MVEEARAFAQRLKQACDEYELCPAHGRGRQVWLAGKIGVSQEAARKWLSAENVPRTKKIKALAKLLEVDEVWLALGVEPPAHSQDAKQFSNQADGADYLMFGLLMMAGYTCAFPERPEDDDVSVYAIRRGVQTSLAVTLARKNEAGDFDLSVPRGYADLVTLAVVPVSDVRFDILSLDPEGIRQHARRGRGLPEITLKKTAKGYSTNRHRWRQVQDLSKIA